MCLNSKRYSPNEMWHVYPPAYKTIKLITLGPANLHYLWVWATLHCLRLWSQALFLSLGRLVSRKKKYQIYPDYIHLFMCFYVYLIHFIGCDLVVATTQLLAYWHWWTIFIFLCEYYWLDSLMDVLHIAVYFQGHILQYWFLKNFLILLTEFCIYDGYFIFKFLL